MTTRGLFLKILCKNRLVRTSNVNFYYSDRSKISYSKGGGEEELLCFFLFDVAKSILTYESLIDITHMISWNDTHVLLSRKQLIEIPKHPFASHTYSPSAWHTHFNDYAIYFSELSDQIYLELKLLVLVASIQTLDPTVN